MQTLTRWLVYVAVVFLFPANHQAQQWPDESPFQQELNLGVRAYKAGDMEKAIEHFRRAKELDPSHVNSRLYLATAHASMYIPGAPSEENLRNGELAVEEFKGVLAIEPNNLSAIDGLGSILSNMAATPYDREKFEESKRYHKRHIELSPNDADPYYWIGFINWTIAYRANDALRREYNKTSIHPIKGDEPLPTSVRANFATTHGSLVDEGIACLDKATALEPDYASAFAYLNLLYRQKADMTDSFQQRKAFLDYADALVETYKQIKQKQLEKAAREPPPSLR